MGHRAYVAYCHESGNISLHYSHWGAYDAKLIEQIGEHTPFGSESMEPEYLNELMSHLNDDEINVTGYLTEKQHDTPVEPDPSVMIESLELLDEIIHPISVECVYVVDIPDNWNVSAYVPVYTGKNIKEPTHETPFRFVEVRNSDEWNSVNQHAEASELSEIDDAYGSKIWIP